MSAASSSSIRSVDRVLGVLAAASSGILVIFLRPWVERMLSEKWDEFAKGSKRGGRWLPRYLYLESTGNVYHIGSCHCQRITFRIQAPRILYTVEVSSKIKFPRLTIACDHLELLSDESVISTYAVNNGPNMGVHTFCSFCGIHVFYSPSIEHEEVSVNADCIDRKTVERIVVTHMASQESTPCALPYEPQQSHVINRRGSGAYLAPVLDAHHGDNAENHLFGWAGLPSWWWPSRPAAATAAGGHDDIPLQQQQQQHHTAAALSPSYSNTSNGNHQYADSNSSHSPYRGGGGGGTGTTATRKIVGANLDRPPSPLYSIDDNMSAATSMYSQLDHLASGGGGGGSGREVEGGGGERGRERGTGFSVQSSPDKYAAAAGSYGGYSSSDLYNNRGGSGRFSSNPSSSGRAEGYHRVASGGSDLGVDAWIDTNSTAAAGSGGSGSRSGRGRGGGDDMDVNNSNNDDVASVSSIDPLDDPADPGGGGGSNSYGHHLDSLDRDGGLSPSYGSSPSRRGGGRGGSGGSYSGRRHSSNSRGNGTTTEESYESPLSPRVSSSSRSIGAAAATSRGRVFSHDSLYDDGEGGGGGGEIDETASDYGYRSATPSEMSFDSKYRFQSAAASSRTPQLPVNTAFMEMSMGSGGGASSGVAFNNTGAPSRRAQSSTPLRARLSPMGNIPKPLTPQGADVPQYHQLRQHLHRYVNTGGGSAADKKK